MMHHWEINVSAIAGLLSGLRCASARLAKLLIVPGPITHQWQSKLITLPEDWYEEVMETLPWYLSPVHIQRWRRTWNDRFVPLIIDKNNGRPWLFCKRFFYDSIVRLYNDPVQFRFLSIHLKPRDAISEVIDHLRLAHRSD